MTQEKISVIIPVHNEKDNVVELTNRLIKVITPLFADYEIIFIDDGTDQTFKLLTELNKGNPNIKGVRFSRRFSHQIAICAGLDLASGDCVVMMDGDLQHPPELIKEFVSKWREGYEIVNGVRVKDQHSSFLLKKVKSAFYSLINYLSSTAIQANSMEFRLLDRKVVEVLASFRERSRFFRGMVSWVGFHSIEIPFAVDRRFSGKSKYSLLSMFRLAADGIFSFSTVPLKITLYMGLFFTFISSFYALVVVILHLAGYNSIAGWTSLIVLSSFFGGVILTSLGVIGEYIGRIFEEVKQRPLYIITKTIGLSKGIKNNN